MDLRMLLIWEHWRTVAFSARLSFQSWGSSLLLGQFHGLFSTCFSCVLACVLDVFYFVYYLILRLSLWLGLRRRKPVWQNLLVRNIVVRFLFLHLRRISFILFRWNLIKVTFCQRFIILLILRWNHVFMLGYQAWGETVRGTIRWLKPKVFIQSSWDWLFLDNKLSLLLLMKHPLGHVRV